MNGISSQALIFAAIAILIAWRIVRRVRRLIGRQTVHPRRLVATIVFFPLLVVLLALPAVTDVTLLEGMVAGALAGIALGLLGLKLTRFEATGAGFFYVPNTLLGVAVSLLFIGRIVYRFGTIFIAGGRFDPATMQSFGRSPLTLALFAVVALYYTTYAIGILAWHRKARVEMPAPPAVDAAGV